MHYTYVIQSVDEPERFYIGYSHDLRARLASHNEGANRSTRGHRWRLVYYEAYVSASGARAREYRLKHNGKAKYQLLKRIRDSLE